MKAYYFMNHSNRNNKTGRNFTKCHIVRAMTGKMISDYFTKIWSLSTSVLYNTRCQERIEDAIARGDNDCICLYCFSQATLAGDSKKSRGMARNSKKNLDILASGFLTWEDIPITSKCDFFRFESHGDTQNVIQALNYIAICEKNEQAGCKTHFTLWTKNIDFYNTVFNVHKIDKPSNLTIIYSSPYLNKVAEIDNNELWFVDKIFTVWTDKETAENAGVTINCCDYSTGKNSNKCKDCRKCYTHNDIRFINECLK